MGYEKTGRNFYVIRSHLLRNGEVKTGMNRNDYSQPLWNGKLGIAFVITDNYFLRPNFSIKAR